jgi:hypothetical protein
MPMRAFSLLCGLFLLISLGSLRAEQLPAMRPALFESGPKSLVNLIDTELLMKRGQTDAMVMFSCEVNDLGRAYTMVTYRGTPNSTALAEEAVKKYRRAAFIPAVYHSKTRDAVIAGTIIYRVVNGKPHLRIYLNQEAEHLKQGDDFIAPQLVFIDDLEYKSFMFLTQGIGYSVTVVLKLNLDATGKLIGSNLIFETPPGKGFGAAVMTRIGTQTFQPAYLHGKPVASSTPFQITSQP